MSLLLLFELAELALQCGERLGQLCDGGVRALERARCFVGAERHRALRALGAVLEHRAELEGLADDGQQRVPVAGDIARAEGLDDDAAQLLGHDGLKERKLNSRKDLDDPDGNRVKSLELQSAFLPRQKGGFDESNADNRLGKDKKKRLI